MARVRYVMFKKVNFVKIGPHFVGLPLFHFKKYQRILWNTLLLGKRLLDFVSPNVKLHNRYCHSPRDVKKQFKTQILIPTLLNFGQAIGMIVIGFQYSEEDKTEVAALFLKVAGFVIGYTFSE